jgi:DNA-cytosine methyltransferase
MSRSPSSIALIHPRTTIAIMTARISRSLATTSATTSDHKFLINDKPYVESNKVKTGHSVKLVDLFAGIGGFHYGVAAAAAQRQLGVRPLLVSEIEESCQEIYQRNHNCEVHGDINKIQLGDFSNLEADIVTAGFPCQPFSNSGRKLGLKDPRGRFYDRIEEIITHFSAKSFILENVPGMTTNGGGDFESVFADKPQTIGKTMHVLEKKLAQLHEYHIKWLEVDSSSLGSPQVRKRVYIIGLRKDLAEGIDINLKSYKPKSFIEIADKTDGFRNEKLELSENQERNVKSFMSKPPSYMNGMRRVGKAYLCDGGNVGQAYHSHGMVPTLTKIWSRFLPIYFPHNGENIPNVGEKVFSPNRYYGKGYLRRASVKEVMLLQGFPKNFKPHATDRIAYEHAGNAVNAKVVKEIADYLLDFTKR